MTPLRDQSNVSRLPRATCPTCGVDVALRRGGQLREHRDERGCICVASGLTPTEVERHIDAEVDGLRAFSRRRGGETQ